MRDWINYFFIKYGYIIDIYLYIIIIMIFMWIVNQIGVN